MTDFIKVPKNTNFLDMLIERLQYLDSAKVSISNALLTKLIRTCEEVRDDNGTLIFILKKSTVIGNQSISICIDNTSKSQTLSEINIVGKTFLPSDNPENEFYFT